MQSDALQKLRFALHHINNNTGSPFINLKEAYLRWLTHINEASIPRGLLPEFRKLMQDIGELAFLNGPLSDKRAGELIVELGRLKERVAADGQWPRPQ